MIPAIWEDIWVNTMLRGLLYLKRRDIVEMERNREKSRCCGAGGGVRSAYPEITEEISKSRMIDAEDVNVEIVITSCPFCILNLDSVCQEKVLDISEIVLRALKGKLEMNINF